jgi:hypothetical protein
VKGARTIEEGGKSVEYKLDVVYKTEATLSVSRPYAYLIPPTFTKAIQNLQHHGVDVDELREDIDLDVEAYKIDSIKAAKGNQAGYGMHNLITLDAKSRKESRKIKAVISIVAGVASTGPLQPSCESSGRRPVWSRWPCVSSTASSFVLGRAGGRFSDSDFFPPWNMPQSTSTRACRVSTM